MPVDPFTAIEARNSPNPSASGGREFFAEIKAGRLKARKFGNRTLIYDQDGRAWLESLPTIVREVA